MKKIFFLSVFSALFATLSIAQNVGIGTTTPSKPFTVTALGIGISQESSPGGVQVGFYTAPGGAYLQTHSNDDLNFATNNGVSRMVLKTNGNFGIRNNTPNASLSVGRGTGNDGTAVFFGTTHSSHFNFSTTENTYIRGGLDNSYVIINDISGGRVGIGMATPRAALEQNGVVGSTSAIFGGEGSGISLQRNWPGIGFNHWHDGNHRSIAPGYSAQFALNQGNGSMYYTSWDQNSATANGLLLGQNQYTRFFISRFGKIGLGTDVPYADLHIVQRTSNRYNEDVDLGITLDGIFDDYSGYQSSWNMHVGTFFESDFTTHSGALEFWENFVSGWSTPAAIATNGEYFQLSDKEFKKDINYLGNDCLDKIIKLKPATYHFIHDNSQSPLDYGFIAQDVEKIFPGFVATFSKNKMIAYSSFIPILTKGIQEQQQQIEHLQKENTDLEARLERLEKIMLKN